MIDWIIAQQIFTILPLGKEYMSLNHYFWVWPNMTFFSQWNVSNELCFNDLDEDFGPIIHQEVDIPQEAASSRKMWRTFKGNLKSICSLEVEVRGSSLEPRS